MVADARPVGTRTGDRSGPSRVRTCEKFRRVRRIVSIAHPDNTASIRIIQKLGFTFQKALDYLSKALDYNERAGVMFAFDVPVRATP